MLKINDKIYNELKLFVYSIIKEYSNERNREDLFQSGMVGVMLASKKYDESLSVKFTTFAYKYILGEVLKTLREDRNIHVCRDIIRDYKKISIAKERYYINYGREPSTSEISEIIKLTEGRINEVYSFFDKEVSLNEKIDIDSSSRDITLEDTLYDKDEIDNLDYLNLKVALENLGKTEQELIYKRYYENKTQTDLAKESNTSQVKIYRYEKKVLDKLRDKML